jgi:isopenicillin-N epimerase
MPADLASFWTLEPGIDFLNHGSYGAAPAAVQAAQARWRERLEAQPVRFFVRDLEEMLDGARDRLGGFLGAPASDLAFVANATAGVNAVLRSTDFLPGDEILITNHAYNACRNAAFYTAERSGARVVVADVPFPVASSGEVVAAITGAVSPRTRLAMIDHVTSATALVFPIERLVAEFQDRDIDVLVDGAHAPGMIDLDIESIGAAYYAGNCHKWLCAPKGAGFLYVQPSHHGSVVPAVVSHGYNTAHDERSRFHLLFDWTGTHDPTAYLAVPAAIDALGGLLPGRWDELRAVNRQLAREARDLLCAALGVPAPAPDEMLGSMAAVPLPDTSEALLAYGRDPLQDRLWFGHGIEVPIQSWPDWPHRLVRVSAQAYNTIDQYERLAHALTKELAG